MSITCIPVSSARTVTYRLLRIKTVLRNSVSMLHFIFSPRNPATVSAFPLSQDRCTFHSFSSKSLTSALRTYSLCYMRLLFELSCDNPLQIVPALAYRNQVNAARFSDSLLASVTAICPVSALLRLSPPGCSGGVFRAAHLLRQKLPRLSGWRIPYRRWIDPATEGAFSVAASCSTNSSAAGSTPATGLMT